MMIMDNEEISITLTSHAKIKIRQRNIDLGQIKKIVSNPELTEPDKFDESLTHFIGSIEGKFLRVICRKKSKKELLIISAFFDRRLTRRKKDDKNQL